MKESTESTKHLLADDGGPVTTDSYRYWVRGSRVATIASILSLLLLSYISIFLTVGLALRQNFVGLDLPYCKIASLRILVRKKL